MVKYGRYSERFKYWPLVLVLDDKDTVRDVSSSAEGRSAQIKMRGVRV